MGKEGILFRKIVLRLIFRLASLDKQREKERVGFDQL